MCTGLYRREDSPCVWSVYLKHVLSMMQLPEWADNMDMGLGLKGRQIGVPEGPIHRRGHILLSPLREYSSSYTTLTMSSCCSGNQTFQKIMGELMLC